MTSVPESLRRPGQRLRLPHSPWRRRGIAEPATHRVVSRRALTAAAAVVVPFALLLLPTSERDYLEIGLAAGIGAALVAFAAATRVPPRLTTLGLPLGYLLMIAVLRDGAGGGVSGFGGLYLLPIVYLALFAQAAQLLIGLAAMAAANVVPFLLVGSPAYPLTTCRGTLVQLGASAVAGFTIQRLVGEAHAHAAEMTLQNERLRDLDRLKDEFVSLVSHELRTPLTSISGYLELVTDEDEPGLSEAQSSYLEVVERNVARLSRLVEDLLYVARLEGGRVELERAPVDLLDVLSHAADAAKPAANAKGVEVVLDAERLPPLAGDPERLAQLVDNLVSNAVKFTPAGGRVSISAFRVDTGIRVEVADTGVGIPDEEVGRLFERFYRASTATGPETPGTGLGLAISQSIAEAHGARIDVTSSVGAGSVFALTLPL